MDPFRFIKRHPALTYFILTFIISWSGTIVVSFFTGMPAPSTVFETFAPIVMLPLVLGPAIVGLFLKRIIDGKEGLKDLFSKLFTWKAKVKWYVLAVLFLPVTASMILFFLSQYSTDFIPNIITSDHPISLVFSGLSVGIILSLFEEMGWTGFAIPELRKRFNIFAVGLLIGALWGAWHFLPTFYGCGDESGRFDFQLFYPGIFFHYFGLIPFRIVLTWVYEKTQSILFPWIMHATLTSCTFFILNISQTGFPLFLYYAALALSLWILAICVSIVNQKGTARRKRF